MLSFGRVFRNAGMAAGQVLVTGIVLFVFYFFLVRELGPEQLGIWTVVLAGSAPVRLGQMGLAAGVVKFVSKYSSLKNEVRVCDVVITSTITLGGFLALALVPIYFAVFYLLQILLPAEHVSEGQRLVPFALISFWIGAISSIYAATLDGVLRTDIRSLIVTTGAVANLLVVLLIVPNVGLTGLAYAQVLHSALVLIASILAVRRLIPAIQGYPMRWRRTVFKEILGYSLKVQAGTFSLLLFDPVAKALMSKFGGLDAVTYFEMANRMIVQARSLVVEAVKVLVPVFSSLKEQAPDRIAGLYRNSYSVLLCASLPVFGGIAALIPTISKIWIGSYEPIFQGFAVFLAVGWFLNTLNSSAFFANQGTGNINWNTLALVIVGLLNILLGLVFGILFGKYGVLAGYISSMVIGSILIVSMYHWKNRVSLRVLLPNELLPQVVTALVVPISVWRLETYLSGEYGWVLAATVSVFVATACFSLATWYSPLRDQLLGLRSK